MQARNPGSPATQNRTRGILSLRDPAERLGQCACERVELARWKSSSGFGLNSVTESHCVAVRRGGEQLEVNGQSVTKWTRFGFSLWRACWLKAKPT